MEFVVADNKHMAIGHKIIKDAFAVWRTKGLDLSPMRQSHEETSIHLLKKGFIIFLNQDPVATVSLEEGEITCDQKIDFLLKDGDNTILYQKIGNCTTPRQGKFLVIKKFAVKQGVAKKGLGLKILKELESLAPRLGFGGTVLETVREAEWLYLWYLQQGYKVIGSHTYSNSKYETVAMLKRNESED